MKFSSKFQPNHNDDDDDGGSPLGSIVGGGHHQSRSASRFGRPKLPLLASLSSSSTSSSTSSNSSSSGSVSDQDQYMLMDDDQSPPISPALRSPAISASQASSMSSWSQAGVGGRASPFDFDAECSNGSSSSSSSQCNSKEDRATYNTKFARYHLETYRQNDRMRWNFDFDHNRPLEDAHHHHHQSVARYQWEPTL